MPTTRRFEQVRARPTGRTRFGLISSLALLLLPAFLSWAGGDAPQTSPISFYERGLDLYRAGRVSEAAALLEKALAESPPDPLGYHSLLGWCRYRLGRSDDALASFENALRLSPGDADALEGKARAAARLSRTRDALDAIATLRRLHPTVQVADLAEQVLARPDAGADRRLSPAVQQVTIGDVEARLVARARGDYFQVRTPGGDWRPIFVKGINLGAALPGRYPSEFPRDEKLYARWLDEMAGMGGNVVRLYTLLPPEFYRALNRHNEGRTDGFLWLVQGAWTELPENDAYDHPEFKGGFQEEMERVIDAIHGNIAVTARRGHAHGLYDADVSTMTLAIVLGREWEPYSVRAYDESLPHPARFSGRHFRVSSGTPTEVWLASVMEHAVAYETRMYGDQRPVSFTNWPTLDPLFHPTEATRDEEIVWLEKLGLPQEPGTLIEYDNDGVSIDTNRIVPTRQSPAGIFATYHAYPYYPDFMNVDPGYLQARDARGPSSYIGYLRELKSHHRRMPLLIAEIGVPTSRGIAHHQPQGWHHGGHNEREQGEVNARMMEDIHQAGSAGGILFAWLDEWFKKNWLVIAFEVPWENNKNWLNILDPEQNYGLVACKPGAGGWKITIDGRGGDWEGIPTIAGDGTGPLRWLRATHDEAYLYLRLDVDRLDFDATRYVLGIDTYGAAAGDHRMPFDLGLTTPTGMEFVVDLRGRDSSRVLCDVPYDLHTNRFNRPWKSFENSDGVFTEMLAETTRRRVGRDGTVFPAVVYSRSPLRYGTMDAASPEYDDLVEWRDNPEEGFIELRLGWNLLNITDPSTRQVLDDPVPPRGGAGHSTTDGFRFYLAAYRPDVRRVIATLPSADDTGRFTGDAIPFYTWAPWEEPTYHMYLKKSYAILRDRLAALAPQEAAER